MPKATVRANAPASPKSAAATAAAPTPKGEPAKDPRIMPQKSSPESSWKSESSKSRRKSRSSNGKRTARPELRQPISKETGNLSVAYVRWIRAHAAVKDPDLPQGDEDGVMKALYAEEGAAKRELFLLRATDAEKLSAKLEAFEHDLVEERRDGPMNDSVLLVALGGIKRDIMDLCEGGK
jgi:hypothetical protein